MDLLRQAISSTPAQEGLLDRVQDRMHDFFAVKEREFDHELVSAERNLKKIKKLAEQIDSRGELHDDPEPVHLNAWAKWLSLNDQIVTDPDQIVKEVDRLVQLVGMVENTWAPHHAKILTMVVDKVLKPAQSDVDEGFKGLDEVFSQYYEPNLDKLMTTRVKLEAEGHVMEMRASAEYLGIGTVLKKPIGAASTNNYQFTLGGEGTKRADPSGGSIPTFTSQQVKYLLSGLEKLAIADVQMARHDRFDAEDEKLHDALMEMELKDAKGDGHKVTEIIKAAERIGRDTFMPLDLSRQINHVMQVILKVCEVSMRRMGSKKTE